MKEEEIQSKIIHDLSILYELSLSSANSSSVIDNCSTFMKVLISRKNLSFAGYWLYNEENQHLESFFSFPAIEKRKSANLDLEFFEMINHEGELINSKDPNFNMLCEACQLEKGSFLIFQIGKDSLIILNRNDKELNNKDRLQLNTVINKFGLFIEGLLSQEKLTEEIQIRRAAEEELKTKTKELKKFIDSNLQLENFAYIASHDLKAPLRTVTSFANLLKDKEYDKFDDKSKSFLDIIIKSSQNMQELIDDLLEYSRTNTRSIKLEEIDLHKLFKALDFELRDSSQKEIVIDLEVIPPKIIADRFKINQLFKHILKNSIKFNNSATPSISIHTSEKPESWIFTIKDNGIGIENEFKEKVFLLFQKLHSVDKFEGSGIGLAICKKIIEQHNGEIWFESEVNKGTSFYVQLPKLKN